VPSLLLVPDAVAYASSAAAAASALSAGVPAGVAGPRPPPLTAGMISRADMSMLLRVW
jgi:hypothetical protein